MKQLLIVSLGILSLSPSSYGFGLGYIGSSPSQQKHMITYTELLEASSGINGGTDGGRTGLLQGNLLFSVPIIRGEKDGFNLTGNLQHLNLSSEPESLTDLYGARFGGTYIRSLDEGKNFSFSLNYGSSSDRPFKDTSVAVLDATVTYSVPENATSKWLFLANYSNNRPFLNKIPLPGFAYAYYSSQIFYGVFGLPFASFTWRFAERWKLNCFALVPWSFQSSISYSVAPPIEIFIGVDYTRTTFLKYGRSNANERLFYREKKMALGVRSPLSQIASAQIESGYSFDRSFFSAVSSSSTPSTSVTLGATWFSKLEVSLRF